MNVIAIVEVADVPTSAAGHAQPVRAHLASSAVGVDAKGEPDQVDADPMRGAAVDEERAARRRLLARARAGDRPALAALWQSHRRWVAVVLLAHKPTDVDLDDLMQEVAVTLMTRLADLRDDDGFRGWLRVVSINAARAAARSAKVRRMHRLSNHPADQLTDCSNGDASLDEPRVAAAPVGGEEGRHLLELAAQLPPEFREPLLLKSLQEMSYRQIATLLGLPETTVETRITRGRRMLRELAGSAGAPRGSLVAS